ncbi:MAG: pilus assembly protein PilM [Betaproteobacteria bacterium]|nr:pilus assembly protein PilM [Betaproteobacteria bacterium]
MQFDFLKVKSPALIGVDISSSAVKMVELADTGKAHYRVERYAIEPLPKESVVDGNIINLENVGETVARAWKHLGSRTKLAALALPSASVITKKIIAPKNLSEHELESQVESEANQYIPFDLDEVNLDFQVLGPAANSAEEVEVLIAASRKEKVEDRLAAIQEAGLKAAVMDVESFATQTAYELLARQLPGNGRNQTVALVDIGASTMHINVVHDHQSVYLREQSFGGNQLTLEIQRRYSLSAEEAELGKRNGGLPENYEPDVLQPFMDTLALEVARALQFFFSSTQYNRVDHILLAGGTAGIAGLDETVGARTRVPTLMANPFADMAIGPHVNARKLRVDAPALVIACGLALRRFDA